MLWLVQERLTGVDTIATLLAAAVMTQQLRAGVALSLLRQVRMSVAFTPYSLRHALENLFVTEYVCAQWLRWLCGALRQPPSSPACMSVLASCVCVLCVQAGGVCSRPCARDGSASRGHTRW
jgi:hypothetical protein